jgi:hypothetical protein
MAITAVASALVAAGLVAGTVPARADLILDVSATMVGLGSNCASTGCMLGGD